MPQLKKTLNVLFYYFFNLHVDGHTLFFFLLFRKSISKENVQKSLTITSQY